MTEQELVEKACRGFLAAIDAHVYVGDRNDLESVIIDGRVNVDACMRAALSVIRGALSEPTEEMLTAAIYAEGPMRPTVGEALAAKWKAMIAASPIGEK